MMTECIWYTKEDFEKEDDRRKIIAMGLVMWGNCMAGNNPPSDFGDAMVIAGQKAGIVPIPDNFSKAAKEITK